MGFIDSPTKIHIIKYWALLFWWVSKRKGRDRARQNVLLAFLIPVSHTIKQHFFQFYRYLDKHWNINTQITNLTQTRGGHQVQGHASYSSLLQSNFKHKVFSVLEKLCNTKTMGWIKDSMFISFGMSLKDSASDSMLDHCLTQITLPTAHVSKPAQCLQLSLASNGCSSPLRHSSIQSETEIILTNSPLIIPSSLILICMQLHSAWEARDTLIFTLRS